MKRIIGSILALSLLTTGAAFAAGQDGRRDQDDRQEHRDDRKGVAKGHDDHREGERHDDGRHDNRGQAKHPPSHKRGERLALGHRGDRVSDYRKHGLKPPPRGHEWRRVDDQYVLIAVATGLIASVIAANH